MIYPKQEYQFKIFVQINLHTGEAGLLTVLGFSVNKAGVINKKKPGLSLPAPAVNNNLVKQIN